MTCKDAIVVADPGEVQIGWQAWVQATGHSSKKTQERVLHSNHLPKHLRVTDRGMQLERSQIVDVLCAQATY